MAADKDNVPLSDTEAAERPVREQLKNASITTMPQDAAAGLDQDAEMDHNEGHVQSNGVSNSNEDAPPSTLQTKRSSEELDRDPHDHMGATPERHHRRKRSRGNQDDEDELNSVPRKISGEKPRDGAGEDTSDAAGHVNGAPSHPPAVARSRTPPASGDSREGEAIVEGVASPKTKRSRLHSSTAQDTTTLSSSSSLGKDPLPAFALPPNANAAASSNPATTAHILPSSTSTITTTATIPPTSAFANTASTSPFSTLAARKSPEPPQTSSAAFASSGFSSLATTSTSGFGAIGKSAGGFGTGGSFATVNRKNDQSENGVPAVDKTTGSAFGGALGQKPAFAAAIAPLSTPITGTSSSSGFGMLGASGFGALGGGVAGSGFGSGLSGTGFSGLGGSAAGLTTFASGKPFSTFASGSKSPRPFGAPADRDDEEDAGDGEDCNDDVSDSGIRSPLSHAGSGAAMGGEKQDERFFKRDLATGEEDEVTEYSCRAKLYSWSSSTVTTTSNSTDTLGDAPPAPQPQGKKEWKERGLGVLRFNYTPTTSDTPTNGPLSPSASAAASVSDALTSLASSATAVVPPSEEGVAKKSDRPSPKARLLMRADGSHRVLLNTPVTRAMSFGNPSGGPPEGGYVYFMGTIDTSAGNGGAAGGPGLEMLQLKIRQQFALELCARVSQWQTEAFEGA